MSKIIVNADRLAQIKASQVKIKHDNAVAAMARVAGAK